MKNARIDNKLPEPLGELGMSWHMFFFFCETRCGLGDVGLEGGHAVYTSREPTNNAGIAILAHHRHNDKVVKVNEILTYVFSSHPKCSLQKPICFVAA